MSRDLDAASWGVVCPACGSGVDGALELRDKPSDSAALFECDVDVDQPVPALESSCFCECAPCCCRQSQHLCPVIATCSCGHSLVDIRTRLQRLLSTFLSWTPPKPLAATLALVSAIEAVRPLLPKTSAVMLRLLDACCLAMLATLGGDVRGFAAVSRMSREAADTQACVLKRLSVGEVLMRYRYVKAAAAAGDCSEVVAGGQSCVKVAAMVMGGDCEAVRRIRQWVSNV